MFALLALAGDLGCTAGPTLVGMVSDSFGGELKTGILVAVIFPALMIVACIVCALMEKNARQRFRLLPTAERECKTGGVSSKCGGRK